MKEEYRRELPKIGKMVLTKEGTGKVIAQEILAQKILVSFEDHRRMLVDLADVITVIGNKSSNGKEETASNESSAS
ncbi:hypothetical protein OAF98_06215 [Planctomicrobium sp.]|nr:hypothetical protein [Planctomicrobium sp.]MDB4744065.1 hypothetical protein [Planctomicrobium sp.]